MLMDAIQIESLAIAPDDLHGFIKQLQHNHPHAPPTVVPPPTLTEELVREMADVAGFLGRMLFSVTDRIFNGDALAQTADLRTPAEIAQFIARWNRPEYLDQAKWFYRPDLLLTAGGFRAVEFNVGASIGGPGICDIHSRAFTQLIRNTSEARRALRYETMGDHWLPGLLDKLEEVTGRRPVQPVFCSFTPNDSIDLADDFTLSDLQTLMKIHGVKYVYGSLEDLDIGSDTVSLNGERLDIVFTDFCYSKFLKAGGSFETLDRLMRAYEKRRFLFLSPPHGVIYDQKLAHRYLTDPVYEQFYSAEEWSKLRRHLCRTQLLTRSNAEVIGAERATWVIKPKFGYGGQGIVVGHGASADEWDSAIDAALAQPGVFIVQEFVEGQLNIADPNLGHMRLACLGPIMNFGKYIGTIYRDVLADGSYSRVINAVAGARYGSVRVSNA